MKKLILYCTCLGIFISCKKEEKEPVQPVITGTLKGKVSHYDQFGKLYTTNLNNTSVIIDNSSLSTVTDGNGVYSFAERSSGTYTLSFKKPGCGLTRIQDIHYKFTDTTNFNVDVADIPTAVITSAVVKDTAWFSGTLGGIYYHATISPANSKATTVAIIGKSPNIDLAHPSSYLNTAPTSLINTLDYNRFLSYSFLSQTYKFKKDSIIYVKIYQVAAIGSSYVDNQLNKPVYFAYGTPYATFTLTMPQ